ncbi:hypothetical protein [Arthrobacter sp. SW1]|uniref:hypothetical protein n=1 Tax=Arthrobacter sp. SW1 TaxID=1920889 RepID=UPI000ABB0E5B|nr:hypothetical protein [Arthrobacter sp. SW1]
MDATTLNAIILPVVFAAIFLYALYFVVRSGVRDGILQADRKRAELEQDSNNARI